MQGFRILEKYDLCLARQFVLHGSSKNINNDLSQKTNSLSELNSEDYEDTKFGFNQNVFDCFVPLGWLGGMVGLTSIRRISCSGSQLVILHQN